MIYGIKCKLKGLQMYLIELITAPDDWNAPDGEHYDAPTIDAIAQKMYNVLQLRSI